jgi:hypothetical protein
MKMKLPIGRWGSESPLRARRTALDTATMAGSWPTTRRRSRSSICNSFSFSPSSSLSTGMPVHLATTAATSSASTSSLSIFLSFWITASFSCSAARSCSSCTRAPNFISEALPRSPVRMACSSSWWACSILDLISRMPWMQATSFCQWAFFCFTSSFRSARVFSSFFKRSRLSLSFSFFNASRSISSWVARREISSISVGIESISMRSRLAASSIRSMALSGWKRSEM